MFDDVPVHVWILITIAVFSYQPARYVFSYVTHSPSRRDITQPPEDLSWRSSALFVRSLVILAALTALAVFIFTPAAARFAKSPSFLPLLAVSFGAWLLFTVPKGLATGQIQPIVRGNFGPYDRKTQPRRFWASLSWNAFFGAICFWIAIGMYGQAGSDNCHNSQGLLSPEESLAACNKLIGEQDSKSDSDLMAARGFAYSQLGDNRRAIEDYTSAIRSNPRESQSYYERGTVFQKMGDTQRALADYNRAIELRPDYTGPYLSRGRVLAGSGRSNEAIADFTKAHEINPKDPWPLAYRGMAYAFANDRTRAEADIEALRAIDPSNIVLLKADAFVSMQNGDLKSAVRHLNEALKREPDDVWLLQMRARAYGLLGETEKWEADTDALWRLQAQTKQQAVGR